MSILLPNMGLWPNFLTHDVIIAHSSKQVRLDINEAKRATSCSKACFVTYSLAEVWSVVCACKSCPSAERPDLTVTLLVHNGKDPPEPVLIIARPLRNTEAPNLRIANNFCFKWNKGNPFFGVAAVTTTIIATIKIHVVPNLLLYSLLPWCR